MAKEKEPKPKVGRTKQERHTQRTAYMAERTASLVGARVAYRAAEDMGGIGVVKRLVDRPKGTRRAGQYLEIETATNRVVRPRSRVAVLPSRR